MKVFKEFKFLIFFHFYITVNASDVSEMSKIYNEDGDGGDKILQSHNLWGIARVTLFSSTRNDFEARRMEYRSNRKHKISESLQKFGF